MTARVDKTCYFAWQSVSAPETAYQFSSSGYDDEEAASNAAKIAFRYFASSDYSNDISVRTLWSTLRRHVTLVFLHKMLYVARKFWFLFGALL